MQIGPPPTPNRSPNPYQGSCTVQGIPIYLENLAGTFRKGKGWRCLMVHHYGEVPGTLGTDGDPVDVFVGPDPEAPTAYVIHQVTRGDGVYDECKVMLGFPSEAEARRGYLACYTPGMDLIGKVTAWPVELLRRWLEDPRHRGQPLGAVGTLQKAQQLDLFGVLGETDVRAHPRRTRSGVTTVTQHRRRYPEAWAGSLAAKATANLLGLPMVEHGAPRPDVSPRYTVRLGAS